MHFYGCWILLHHDLYLKITIWKWSASQHFKLDKCWCLLNNGIAAVWIDIAQFLAVEVLDCSMNIRELFFSPKWNSYRRLLWMQARGPTWTLLCPSSLGLLFCIRPRNYPSRGKEKTWQESCKILARKEQGGKKNFKWLGIEQGTVKWGPGLCGHLGLQETETGEDLTNWKGETICNAGSVKERRDF